MTSLEESTGFLVVRTARTMKKALDAKLSEYGLTTSQLTVLNALAKEDGLSLSVVGKRVYLDKPAITGLADRLEKDNFVERRRTSTDRRVIQLFLTNKGSNLLQELDEIATKVDQQLVSVLAPKELTEFRNLLNCIWEGANNSN
ncbi:MAG: MarR family transcriptional regulator [Candidatus Marinimicrobia bacterium]|jgi:DNA-binding MarR family transcriptional regulator|nr:MarR family transcriptional regulator [Candidatus Neomarinimicrobiota bacterium]MDP7025776.1 MarR family transcriptional regulator [Candidatus Neomarinimicrobiota bacterium]|tara:strand:- start:3939 stop:4370 length:432 start_codon:yes stop_codon:yes gene_type:complete